MTHRLVRVALSALLAMMALSLPATASASPATEATVTALDYNSTGWRYLQVAADADVPLFHMPGFDDSGWASGQAAFGTSTGCAYNASVKTQWDVGTDILLRHWVHLPANAQEVRIHGTVDNDALVYLNGHLLQSVQSGSCQTDAIDVVVAREALRCGNLLAIRGHDYGQSTFLDVRITYTTSDGV